MKKPETITYSDELNDEFSGVKRESLYIGDKYVYIHKNIFFKIGEFIVYRLIMHPVAFLYLKFKFHHKVVNKKLLKDFRNGGYFLYGNHTQIPGDAYIPNVISNPKKTYVVVNGENLALKGTRTYMSMVGAIPLPSDLRATRNFFSCVEKRLLEKSALVIYPEAHIWPYYTSIRPFTPVSFTYPVKFKTPVFSFTVTYRKRKHSRKANIVTYIDGPFFPDEKLSEKEAKQVLRDQVYNAMKKRADAKGNYAFIEYKKKEGSK